MENSIDKSIMESIDKINALNNEYEYKCACALLEATNRAKLIQENCLHEENLNQFTIMQEAYQYYMESDDEEDDDEDDDNEESSDNNGGIGKWATSKKMKKSVFGTSNEEIGTRIAYAIPRLLALIVRTIKNIINPTAEKVAKTASDASSKASQVKVEGVSPEEIEKSGGSKITNGIKIAGAVLGAGAIAGGTTYGFMHLLRKIKNKNNADPNAPVTDNENTSDDGETLTEEDITQLNSEIQKFCNEYGIDEDEFTEAFMLLQMRDTKDYKNQYEELVKANKVSERQQQLIDRINNAPELVVKQYKLSPLAVHAFKVHYVLLFPDQTDSIFINFDLTKFKEAVAIITDINNDYTNSFTNYKEFGEFYKNPSDDNFGAYMNSISYGNAITNNMINDASFNTSIGDLNKEINRLAKMLDDYNKGYNNGNNNGNNNNNNASKNANVFTKITEYYAKILKAISEDFDYWDHIYDIAINNSKNLRSMYSGANTTFNNTYTTSNNATFDFRRQNGVVSSLDSNIKTSTNIGNGSNNKQPFVVSHNANILNDYTITINGNGLKNVNINNTADFISNKLNELFKRDTTYNLTASVNTMPNNNNQKFIRVIDNNNTVKNNNQTKKINKITNYIQSKLQSIISSNDQNITSKIQPGAMSSAIKDANNLNVESYKLSVPIDDMFNCNWYSYIGSENADAIYGSAQKIVYSAINEHDASLGLLAMNMLRYSEATAFVENRPEDWYCEFSSNYTTLKNEFGDEFIRSYVTMETSSIKDVKEKYEDVCDKIEDLERATEECNCKDNTCDSCVNMKYKLKSLNKEKQDYMKQLKTV